MRGPALAVTANDRFVNLQQFRAFLRRVKLFARYRGIKVLFTRGREQVKSRQVRIVGFVGDGEICVGLGRQALSD